MDVELQLFAGRFQTLHTDTVTTQSCMKQRHMQIEHLLHFIKTDTVIVLLLWNEIVFVP